MLFSSQNFTKAILTLFICIYFFSFIQKTTADETSMQEISNFSIDINEVTIGDFYKFITSTNYKTKSEKRGWGYVYEFGWVKKRGWNWKNPYGVNGLYDMGANVWEWANIKNKNYKATKGGSWWYGKEQMHFNHIARKDRNMSAVYIGFRCIKQN